LFIGFRELKRGAPGGSHVVRLSVNRHQSLQLLEPVLNQDDAGGANLVACCSGLCSKTRGDYAYFSQLDRAPTIREDPPCSPMCSKRLRAFAHAMPKIQASPLRPEIWHDWLVFQLMPAPPP
jgi:hypothetical protein